ncbi:Fungal transcriptional regulatory protein [Cordyceps fumosorosea ARSEF 2679]|uniref:Fungal transcriptional regulatory protein n=1 Tax=Cordyceps fumosorosea (strain ARSEF 2679) TaxID=1081104 RepID=A0A162IBW4_CORFA|nr:Fungal transcriptional regulatory protein [Cordyceps fumosorosea ARSEF 2679]OAA54905.1 Fungal transcriptional regulatory protein [Cordyceps fumosorosea ARSEF 2679]
MTALRRGLEWPCNHCLKRKVADKCRFALPAANAPVETCKRQASPDEVDPAVIPPAADFQPGTLGYHTANLLASLGLEDKASMPVLLNQLQISAGLARPTIVNWSAVEVVLPALTMEAFSPSPMLHMKIQSQLISQLAVKFPNDKENLEPSKIRQYQTMVEAWAKAFPQVYAFDNPDTAKDETNPWIIFNRFYLYTMAYFLLLASIRPVMLKGYTSALSEEEQGICCDGIKYCAKNIRVAVLWADHVDRHGGGYHFMISSVFDTVVLLCTCIMKDVDNTMAKKDEMYDELDNAVSLFGRLAHTSSIAKFAFGTASQLVPKLQRPNTSHKPQKRQKTNANAVLPKPATYEASGLSTAPSPGLAEETGSETSPEQLSRDDSTPGSMSDDWQGSTDRGTSSAGDPRAGLGTIDESLSPWPTDSYDEPAAAEDANALGVDFQFMLEQQETDEPANQTVQLDDFAALWDWEALGLGTYPLQKHADFGA